MTSFFKLAFYVYKTFVIRIFALSHSPFMNYVRRMIVELVKGISSIWILIGMIVGSSGDGGDRNSDCFGTGWLNHGAIFHFRLSRLQHAHTAVLLFSLLSRHKCQLLLMLLLLVLLLLLADFVSDDVLALYRRRRHCFVPLLLLNNCLPSGLRRWFRGPDISDQDYITVKRIIGYLI